MKTWAILLPCLLVSSAQAQNPQPDSPTAADKSGAVAIQREPTFKVGVDILPPRVVYSPDPEYSEEARRAALQGVCVLSLVVGSDGKTRDIRVARSLGLGLDEKSLEAIRSWRFEPATKKGQAVSVLIEVEVGFRLSSSRGVPETLLPIPENGNDLVRHHDKHAAAYPSLVDVHFVTGRRGDHGYLVTAEASIVTGMQPRKINATCGPKGGCLMLGRGKYSCRWLSSNVIELRGRTEDEGTWQKAKFSVADAP